MNGQSAITMSAWLWIDDFYASSEGYFYCTDDGTIFFGLGRSGATSTLRWDVRNGASYSANAYSSNALATGAWQHIVGTWAKGVNGTVYLNGIKGSVYTDWVNVTMGQAAAITLGMSQYSATDRHAHCRITEIAIWNRQLSDDEVTELYNSGRGKYMVTSRLFVSSSKTMGTNLMLAYHVDENTGTNFTDLSGNGRTGSLGTGTWVTGKTFGP
jgi:hypothetical protein